MKELREIFYKRELQKTNQREFRVEKIKKNRKGDKLYVKHKGNQSSFNSMINKNDIVYF